MNHTRVTDITSAVDGKRFHYVDEKDLQAGLAGAFDDAGITYEREYPLTGGIVDFLVGDIGVEVKIKGSASALSRQLTRYSRDIHINELLVISTRPEHRTVLSTLMRVGIEVPVHCKIIGALS